MSQVPGGDRSDYVVKYEFDTARRDTFQPFIDELRQFIDGKCSVYSRLSCYASSTQPHLHSTQ